MRNLGRVVSTIVALIGLLAGGRAGAWAQTVVYDDALWPGWTSWSWDGEYAFDHADDVVSGQYSISASELSFGALSFHSDRTFADATGVSFWLRGDGDTLVVFLHADGEEFESEQVFVRDFVEATPDHWSLVTIPFTGLGVHEWTRINLMNRGTDSVDVLVDDVLLQGVDFPVADDPLDEVADMGADVVDDLADAVDDGLEGDADAPDDAAEGELESAPEPPPDADDGSSGDSNSGCQAAGRWPMPPPWVALVVGLALLTLTRRRRGPVDAPR